MSAVTLYSNRKISFVRTESASKPYEMVVEHFNEAKGQLVKSKQKSMKMSKKQLEDLVTKGRQMLVNEEPE